MTLERIEHKVFASEAPLDEMGQFGSALATTKLNTKDVAEIQALPAYTKGWGSAIISENNYPAMEEMNGVLNVMSYHTGYLYQEGIPTYSATQEYSVTSWVKDLAGEKVYKSLQGGNKGHDLTDPAWWKELKLGGGGLEIGDIGFTQMAIDESKGKRRVLNGQLIIQDQYVQFTNIIKNSVALNPDLVCTESEWQTAVTMSANGVCYKFVIDNEQGIIRLPKYPTYLDLSINTSAKSQTVSVYGNGKALGLTNGTTNYGLYGGNDYGTFIASNLYNANVGATGTVTSGSEKALGVTTDASKSGITGKVTVPAVQSEKVKGTYFIQVATGAETEDNIINEIELNNPFSLLDYKYSEYELNNLSWLRSNGQYNSKAIYPAVYDLLLKIYNGTETKAGVSVKLSTETFTDYDFVLNTAEETFRLPIKVKLASGKAVVGNGMTLGFTNGEKNFGLCMDNLEANNRMFNPDYYGQPIANTTVSFTNENHGIVGITTDPSKSGIETSDSDLYLYFYVGETVQNANLINAGRVLEILPNKLDKKQLYNKITNCITEIPQRIKLEFNNGVLTLKAGSEVIVPNGFEANGTTPKFDYVVTTRDFSNSTETYAGNTEVFLFAIVDNGEVTGVYTEYKSKSFSGTETPTVTSNYDTWYNTNVNLVKRTSDNGATWVGKKSLPLNISYRENGLQKSLGQVFNGFGYIGSTAWADKGIKFLSANGRNADGTLKNLELETPKVMIKTNHLGANLGWWRMDDINLIDMVGTRQNYFEQEEEPVGAVHTVWYKPSENITRIVYSTAGQWNKFNGFYIASSSADSTGRITSFNPKEPFRAVDYNEFKNLNDDVKGLLTNGVIPTVDYSAPITISITNGTYTAPSDGYLIANRWGAGNSTKLIIRAGSDTGNEIYTVATGEYPGRGHSAFLPLKKGQVIHITVTGTYYIKFYSAQ